MAWMKNISGRLLSFSAGDGYSEAGAGPYVGHGQVVETSQEIIDRFVGQAGGWCWEETNESGEPLSEPVADLDVQVPPPDAPTIVAPPLPPWAAPEEI